MNKLGAEMPSFFSAMGGGSRYERECVESTTHEIAMESTTYFPVAHRYKEMLNGLKAVGEEHQQLTCLSELCEMLSMATEEV
jgi:hypothetical protein